jgi:hypothetical protein
MATSTEGARDYLVFEIAAISLADNFNPWT